MVFIEPAVIELLPPRVHARIARSTGYAEFTPYELHRIHAVIQAAKKPLNLADYNLPKYIPAWERARARMIGSAV